MAIFIFEDNIFQGQSLKRIIESICKKKKILYDSILLTHHIDTVMENITLEKNIYFLDIEIHQDRRKGFHLAQKIRKIDNSGIIVFVTTHSNFAPISYGYMVSALNFIDKNSPIEFFNEEIEKCLIVYSEMQTSEGFEDYISINTSMLKLKLKTSEVIYFEVVGPHKIELTALNRKITFQSNLKDLENINSNLIKCHQSFIINKHHVIELNKTDNTLIMTNNSMIPISKRRYYKIKNELFDT